MLDISEMKKLLQKSLPNKRYKHSLEVYETALLLAKEHQVDAEKVAVAALLHDCGREVPTGELLAVSQKLGLKIDEIEGHQPILLHAKLGVYYAQQKYGVIDESILNAIRYHTTGVATMTPLAMVVYLADLLEPTRDFKDIDDLRAIAATDLEKAMLIAYGQTIRYLSEYDLLIHPDCLEGYNELAIKFKRLKLKNRERSS